MFCTVVIIVQLCADKRKALSRNLTPIRTQLLWTSSTGLPHKHGPFSCFVGSLHLSALSSPSIPCASSAPQPQFYFWQPLVRLLYRSSDFSKASRWSWNQLREASALLKSQTLCDSNSGLCFEGIHVSQSVFNVTMILSLYTGHCDQRNLGIRLAITK